MGRKRKYTREFQAFKQSHLWQKYQWTKSIYEHVLLMQGGACAICAREDSGHKTKKAFVVDHDHETGHPRGLLCYPCNMALGLMQDNTANFSNAIHYLKSA